MDRETAEWIAEAKANIAKHERNITAALYRSDYTTAEKLGQYRDGLVAAIKRLA